MGSPIILFEDIFNVKDIDPDGKKFEKVSRFYCVSESYEMDLFLDVNTDIYQISEEDRFTLVLAPTLDLHGAPDDGIFNPIERPSLADKYEYVMYGKVFKYQEETQPTQKVSLYLSFGGLLMLLKGDPRNLQGIEPEARLYLLIRKV
eukprot:TRINITY_DN8520_c0_g1_i2.p1 TRINITY_DN8520_c0_g1~~TRINITY_DN8520_c0_g1_i2.p1  ORF type:complete len:156 (-),score=35.53 TRINITY_DN8520_c0_g1_i2:24-464(-)